MKTRLQAIKAWEEGYFCCCSMLVGMAGDDTLNEINNHAPYGQECFNTDKFKSRKCTQIQCSSSEQVSIQTFPRAQLPFARWIATEISAHSGECNLDCSD